jgi:hypothetical protein
LTVALTPDAARTCRVTFVLARALVPAHVEAGSTDSRALGVHFLAFAWRP